MIMKIPKGLLTADLIVQTIIVIPTVTACLAALIQNDYVIFALVGQFLLGCWQVMSAMVFGFGYGDARRRMYLMLAAIYLGLAGAVTFFISDSDRNPPVSAAVFGWMIIPMVFAFIYWLGITSPDVRNYQTEQSPPPPPETKEGVPLEGDEFL